MTQQKEQQKKLLSEIMEADQKSGLYENHIVETNKMVTAVEWLFQQLWETPKDKLNWYAIRSKALQMEQEKEYETKSFWYGRGILAGKEDRIGELKPKRT